MFETAVLFYFKSKLFCVKSQIVLMLTDNSTKMFEQT